MEWWYRNLRSLYVKKIRKGHHHYNSGASFTYVCVQVMSVDFMNWGIFKGLEISISII